MSKGVQSFEKGIYAYFGLGNFELYSSNFYEKLQAEIHLNFNNEVINKFL